MAGNPISTSVIKNTQALLTIGNIIFYKSNMSNQLESIDFNKQDAFWVAILIISSSLFYSQIPMQNIETLTRFQWPF